MTLALFNSDVRQGSPTMVGLTKDQRQMLLDKLPDAANLLLGALGLSQFLSDRGFSMSLALAGIVGWLGLFGVAFWLGRGGARE